MRHGGDGPVPPPVGGGRYHCVAGGPDATAHRLAWSPDRRKWFATDLATKRIFHIGNAMKGSNGPIAQLDRVTDFYSVGCRFESCWDRQPFLHPLILRRKGRHGPTREAPD